MKRLLCLLCLGLLLTGCGSSAGSIPDGLSWTAQALQSQETGELLAAAPGTSSQQEVPVLNLTAQVENGQVTLTDLSTGERCQASLTPMEDARPGSDVYTLLLPDGSEGYGVYGVTQYSNGDRDATLYLVADGKSLRLTAPLPEE